MDSVVFDEAVSFASQQFEFKKIYLAEIFEHPHLVQIPDNSEILAWLEKAARDPGYCDTKAFDILKSMAGDFLLRGGFCFGRHGEKFPCMTGLRLSRERYWRAGDQDHHLGAAL